MSFLHPEFFTVAFLVAAPLIIHLLTRLRYRRVRWAAIDFLLNSERKAVRRAKLQQILLMLLRTLVLAAALMALLEPMLRGNLGRLLGAGNKIVILLDCSASTSSSTPIGTCFERGQRAALSAVAQFPRGTAAAFGAMAGECRITSREPLRDLRVVSNAIKDARRTDGEADIPQAITAAAETLKRSGGGGVIWILTDAQAADWRPVDSGAWESTRKALEAAGKPEVVFTPIERAGGVNFSFAGIALSPPVPAEGDAPKLTATVQLNAERRPGAESAASQTANVSLFFDGDRVDSKALTFSQPGRADLLFAMPKLKAGVHAGFLQLDVDAIPADNFFYFTVNTEDRVPILVVDGAPSGRPDQAPSHFLSLALKPSDAESGYHSPFLPNVIDAAALADAKLQTYEAVFLADVPSLAEAARQRLDQYVRAGGLLVVFPGKDTVADEWTAEKFPNVPLQPFKEFPRDKAAKVTEPQQQNPLTQTLMLEGLGRLLIQRIFPIAPPASAENSAAQVLLSTDRGQPFLVVQQIGKGRVFFFAVSAQTDFSNLPYLPFFPPTIHRIVLSHIVEKGATTSHRAFTPLTAPVLTEWPRILTPDGRVASLTPIPNDPGKATFEDTGVAGIYRLTATPLDSTPPKNEGGPIAGVINVPPEESSMELAGESVIGNLLQGTRVTLLPVSGDIKEVGRESSVGTWSFPFALIALCAILAAVLLAWAIDRPAPARSAAEPAGGK